MCSTDTYLLGYLRVYSYLLRFVEEFTRNGFTPFKVPWHLRVYSYLLSLAEAQGHGAPIET